ncbi:hypothetical protein BC351_37570 [Paenibacillus ferrarius]|uniref:Uncharacterized protein n=1 Tax=Paenibacillus ferrarius TaxID=1469647 RepID=A0A1V4HB30_9BACL|nr:hypothetical protein [Paenibacillus ferrarius]OPH49299.1 hypothetical protein BC351_37570 [Paenibacillus ferrarius]
MASSYFNEWLDTYNDYMRLYAMFGDKEYLEQAAEVLQSLRAIIARDERHKAIIWKIKSPRIHAF